MISRRRVVCIGFGLALAGLTLGSTPVATQESDSFFIFGLVKSAGKYRLVPEMTVGGAIDAAGGYLNRKISGIEIIRIVNGERETVAVSHNDAVRPNDTIVVKGER